MYGYFSDYQSYLGNNLNNIQFDRVENNDIINNIKPFLDLNENDIAQEDQNPDRFSSFLDPYSFSSIYECNTNWRIVPKMKDFSHINDFNQENESIFKYMSFQEITNNFNKNNLKELYDNFKNIEDAKYKLNKKRKRKNESFVIIFKKEEAGHKNKRETKVNPDNKKIFRIEDNKNTEDRIFKEIKTYLLKYSLIFLNNILESSNINKRFYQIDYKYTTQLKKAEDMSLKELYSLGINHKLKYLSKDYNKILIEEIIRNKERNDYETIMFVFNLSFGDWIELFCHKKDINEILKKNKGIHDINEEKIKNNLIGVEELLKWILEKNDKNYFSYFTFFLYNYKSWF